ncbi:MAG TPA: ATP-binding protein [Candidatus Binataceae bacterium]|nr:ATP-binding protein [Candidatus Binataceae bacterium]
MYPTVSQWLEPFVGREREIGGLQAMIDDARFNGGRLILVRGDKGIGKTRLAVEFATRAAAEGSRVLWGHWEAAAGCSSQRQFRVFAADVEPHAPLVLLSQTVDKPEDLYRLASRMRHEVLVTNNAAPRDSDSLPALAHSPLAADSATHRARQCLIVVDDLQPSDRLSLLLLCTLLRELRSIPCVILGVYEGNQIMAAAEADVLIDDLADQISSIELSGLSEAQVERLAAAVIGECAESSLIEAIYKVSRGHPAMVKQLASLVRARHTKSATVYEMPQVNRVAPQPSSCRHSDTLRIENAANKKWLTREGDYWTLRLRGRVLRLRHLKGLTYINHLMEQSGKAVPALELASLEQSSADRAELGSNLPFQDSDDLHLRRDLDSDAGPALDPQAKEAYRRRLSELEEELDTAREFNDLGRIAKLQQEHEFLMREMARAIGLRGRDRKEISIGERARVSVTHAIKFVIQRIAREEPELGRLLSAAIRTGLYCSFMAELLDETPWQQPWPQLESRVA